MRACVLNKFVEERKYKGRQMIKNDIPSYFIYYETNNMKALFSTIIILYCFSRPVLLLLLFSLFYSSIISFTKLIFLYSPVLLSFFVYFNPVLSCVFKIIDFFNYSLWISPWIRIELSCKGHLVRFIIKCDQLGKYTLKFVQNL